MICTCSTISPRNTNICCIQFYIINTIVRDCACSTTSTSCTCSMSWTRDSMLQNRLFQNVFDHCECKKLMITICFLNMFTNMLQTTHVLYGL